jgi:hypothetical protein
MPSAVYLLRGDVAPTARHLHLGPTLSACSASRVLFLLRCPVLSYFLLLSPTLQLVGGSVPCALPSCNGG